MESGASCSPWLVSSFAQRSNEIEIQHALGAPTSPARGNVGAELLVKRVSAVSEVVRFDRGEPVRLSPDLVAAGRAELAAGKTSDAELRRVLRGWEDS